MLRTGKVDFLFKFFMIPAWPVSWKLQSSFVRFSK